MKTKVFLQCALYLHLNFFPSLMRTVLPWLWRAVTPSSVILSIFYTLILKKLNCNIEFQQWRSLKHTVQLIWRQKNPLSKLGSIWLIVYKIMTENSLVQLSVLGEERVHSLSMESPHTIKSSFSVSEKPEDI